MTHGEDSPPSSCPRPFRRQGESGERGIIAYDPSHYGLLKEALTPQRVKAHFGAMVGGIVERFEMENIHALNFVLHDALEGGGTVSLMTDAQAKVTATAFLRLEIEVPDALAEEVKGRGRVPAEVAKRLLSGWDPTGGGRGKDRP
ncbi:MAG: AtuA-related protein [Longimicrobiales bacterium]